MWVSRSPSPASTSYAQAEKQAKQSHFSVRDPSRRVKRSRCQIILCKATTDNDVTVREGVENLVIIGSGPAGYTAAIYAARANLRPLIFEGLQVGGPRGGQLMTTSEVENFPGFPEGIQGPDLMDRMRAQAERWGSELITEDVEFLDLKQRPFLIRSSEVEVKANSIILATGATAKRLNLPSEEEFWNKGISACAICDGSNPLFKQQELAVVGGGDTAVEEALYLTKYGKKVHLLVRGDKLRASGSMQDRVNRTKAVEIHYHTSVQDVTGDSKGVKALKIKNSKSGEESELKVRGLFYGIGHQPNSHLFKDDVELDEGGYVKLQSGVSTNVEGVFAAGDIFDKDYRQAVTAAGSGCMAALSAERYLVSNNILQEFHRDQEPDATPLETAKQEEKKKKTPEEIDVNAIKHTGQLALRKLYHESKRPIVVFYSAPGCGPCRTLKPIVNGVIDEFDTQVHLIDIDIDVDSEVAVAGGVSGTPTIQIFKNKALVQHLPGVKMKRDYRKFISDALELQNS